LRRAWLDPPDLVEIVPEVTPTAASGEAPRRYPDRILPKNAEAAVKLKERTLTNLYNQRPRWLADAHDAATARSPLRMTGPRTFRPRTLSPIFSGSTLRERACRGKYTTQPFSEPAVFFLL
jgi:hypothetical protein